MSFLVSEFELFATLYYVTTLNSKV